MTALQTRAIDMLWRQRTTSKPVLVIRKKMSAADRKALELAKKELGPELKVVYQTVLDEDVLPRLFASVSIYRGLADIEAFLGTLQLGTAVKRKHQNGSSHRRVLGQSRMRRSS